MQNGEYLFEKKISKDMKPEEKRKWCKDIR